MSDYAILLLILAFICLIGGCANLKEDPPKPRDVTLKIHDAAPLGAETPFYAEVLGHTVFFPFAATQPLARSVRLRIVAAVEAHVTTFQKNEGVSVAPCVIIVTSEQAFPTVRLRNALGCFVRPRTIFVWNGASYELPALTHELAHYCFAPTDISHTDPRWPTWEAREANVNKRIVEEHRN
jgi:hypothetical protein